MPGMTAFVRRAPTALAAGVAAVAALAGCSRSSEPAGNQAVSWTLKVGPQGGDQPIVCASDRQPPCVITRGVAGQRIEAQTAIALPGTANHRFTGEVLVGFVGDDLGPAAHALRVDQTTTSGTGVDVIAIGLVTFKPGMYQIQIRLEETGGDLPMPRQHTIDVMVQVR